MTSSALEVSGTACLPEWGGGMVAGRLGIRGGEVRFECGRGVVSWPLADVELKLGGHNDHHLFLHRRGVPHALLSTADLALLEHPALAGYAGLRASAERARRQAGSYRRPMMALGLLLLLALGGVVVVVAQKDRLVGAVVGRIPLEWERELGRTLQQQMARDRTLVTASPEQAGMLGVVTNALLPVIRGTGMEFQFYIVEDTNVNAFAIPGGHVFIHTGLLGAVRRPEELAGVLAHEIAHVTRRHGLRKLLESAGVGVLVSAVLGDAAGLSGAVVEGSRFLLTQKYSRDFEREADDVGWGYLVAAGIDPRGLIEFFGTLQRVEAGATGAAGVSLLSTHPATAERMERLEAKWRELPQRGTFRPLRAGGGG
jgi:predicted Zn-dependent protease